MLKEYEHRIKNLNKIINEVIKKAKLLSLKNLLKRTNIRFKIKKFIIIDVAVYKKGDLIIGPMIL